ncbi:glycosyltransferase family 39 protein [Candidatus Microgenomates bacterium]|nr:glycosyltransferase family 39 protein [Candidatus Microgenomates bacterium]
METKISSQNSKFAGINRWLLAILLLAAFLRLFRIADYMTFLGDEGRDVLIVKHILEGDLTLLGPTASVGGFFLGPIYYYFMVPFLWLFGLNPVGPAVMVALFGIATVYLVYHAGKKFFGEKAGLIASALYAVSPLVIAYSRSSWNPNLMPFFSLLGIIVVYQAVAKNSWRLFILLGILLGIAMQLHYLTTFFVVVIAVYLLFARLYLGQGVTLIKNFGQTLAGFLLGFSPFLAFEVRHGFPNINTVIRFMFGSTGETGFAGEKFTGIVGDVFFRLFGRLITRFPPPEQVGLREDPAIALWYYGTAFLGMVSVGALIFLFVRAIGKNRSDVQKFGLLLFWFFISILLFGFYKKPIYDYYFGFIFPLPFLLVGFVLAKFYEAKKLAMAGKVLAVAIFLSLFLYNLDGMPFKHSPNRQLAQVEQISQFVLEKTEGQPFNFALLTLGNSDHGYRYFFELKNNPPVTIENEINDPARKTVTDQLLIVCEDPNCKPLGDSLWEVAGFGRAEIAGEWQVSVVKVYKLTHFNSF